MTSRTSRRHVLALAPAVGVVGVLTAACGAFGEAPPTKVKAPVTLRVHTRTGNDLDKYFIKRKPDFEAQHTHVTLEVDAIAGGPLEYVTKLLVVHAGGDLGDAAWGTSRGGFIRFLGTKNVFSLVEPLAKADKYPLTDFYPAALNEATYQGKLYALPHITEPGKLGVLYNRAMFAQNGQRVPDLTWTTDTLTQAAIAMSKGPTDERDVFGFLGSYGYLDFMPTLRTFGGEVLSADGTKCVLDSAEAMAAVTWQHDLIRRHVAMPPQNKQPTGGFDAGKIAMQTNYPLTIVRAPAFYADKFQIGTTMIPKGPKGERGTVLNSHTMGVTSTTKHKEEAWAWVKFSSSKEFSVDRITTGNGGPNGRHDVWRNERLLKEIPDWKDWADLMDKAKIQHVPANLRGQDMEDALNRSLNAIWNGMISPADGVKQAVTAINEILKQPPA